MSLFSKEFFEPSFLGANIVVSDLAPQKELKQVRFPRSKGKRIRKKWAKDRRNFELVENDTVWMIGGDTFIMSPSSYQRARESLKNIRPSLGHIGSPPSELPFNMKFEKPSSLHTYTLHTERVFFSSMHSWFYTR